MSPELRGKLYMVIFAIFATLLGFYIWSVYRPKVILAECTNLAQKSTQTYSRTSLPGDVKKDYESILDECLADFGYNAETTKTDRFQK